LQSLDFAMEAAHPMFGKVILKQPDSDTADAVTLILTPQGPQETWL
jgi:hypothetical protein